MLADHGDALLVLELDTHQFFASAGGLYERIDEATGAGQWAVVDWSRARHVDAFLDELDRELDLLATTPAEQIDTTLLVHPALFPDFGQFNDFLGVVDDVVAEHDLEGVIQVAPFHPLFQFEGTEPDDITNATNRSPYPTLHLLREDSVARAVASEGGDADAIVARNMDTLRRLGPQGWRELLSAPGDTKA